MEEAMYNYKQPTLNPPDPGDAADLSNSVGKLIKTEVGY
jgi:hypothetical protein